MAPCRFCIHYMLPKAAIREQYSYAQLGIIKEQAC